MGAFAYAPYTAQETALALSISDCDDMMGEDIAKNMLRGVLKVTRKELSKLAAFKGVSVTYLTEHDPAFRRYADPVMEVRKAVAKNILRRNVGAEFAAEVCGLPVHVVERLK